MTVSSLASLRNTAGVRSLRILSSFMSIPPPANRHDEGITSVGRWESLR